MLQDMTGRTAPSHPSPTHAAILAEVKRQGISGYALTKASGLTLSTVQRFMAGENSPTIATLEAIAKALGLAIEVRKGGPV